MEAAVTALFWFSAMVAGLMAGLYFAFSSFIIRALCAVDRSAGITAMKAINAVILRTMFLPLFISSNVAELARERVILRQPRQSLFAP